MVPLAMHRLVLDVGERVVHPPHVPFEAEAQTAEMRRAGHARPRGRLLRDGHRPGVALVDGGVGLLEERHGLEVLATAVDVRCPLAGLAAVVEIEHRGDGVDAEPVDVELLEPVRGVRHEEVADLPATEVEDVRAPVHLLASPRVGVLVERGAVEAGESPGVLGEVPRHPVEDDPDPGLVQAVDELPEVVGRAEARGGRVVAGDLVSPRRARTGARPQAAARRG